MPDDKTSEDQLSTASANENEYLPYATDFINTACYCLETLTLVDAKLLGKDGEEEVQQTKKRMLSIIHSAGKAMHDDWFDQIDQDDPPNK